jgi:hypothetical protein
MSSYLYRITMDWLIKKIIMKVSPHLILSIHWMDHQSKIKWTQIPKLHVLCDFCPIRPAKVLQRPPLSPDTMFTHALQALIFGNYVWTRHAKHNLHLLITWSVVTVWSQLEHFFPTSPSTLVEVNSAPYSYSLGIKQPDSKVTIHFHLVPMSRIHGAIPPHPSCPCSQENKQLYTSKQHGTNW